MHKFEILNKVDYAQLNNFLTFVQYPKFNLFPNVNNVSIHNYLFDIINNSFKDSTIFSYSVNSDIIAMVAVRLLDWDSKHFGYKSASIDNIFYKYWL